MATVGGWLPDPVAARPLETGPDVGVPLETGPDTMGLLSKVLEVDDDPGDDEACDGEFWGDEPGDGKPWDELEAWTGVTWNGDGGFDTMKAPRLSGVCPRVPPCVMTMVCEP